jgi:predicted O-methyltransferase YrrM
MVISFLGLKDIVDSDKTMTGLEIGCYRGDGANWLLNNFPNLTLHSIDPYLPYADWNGAVNCSAQDMTNGKTVEEIARETLSKHETSGRFMLNKKTSDDAVVDYNNEFFDFIFIDGLHTYNQVFIDCQKYYSKVKSGGIFAGHDYNTISDVRRAVDIFATSKNKDVIQIPTDAWYWIK